MAVTPKSYNQIFTKGYLSALGNTPINDGKLRVTKDSGDIYIDIIENGSQQRIQLGVDIVKGNTEEEIRSILSPLPKFYFASDTHNLLIYMNNDWVTLNADNATNDESGNNIKSTYGSALDISENQITLKNKNNTTVSAITVPYATKAAGDESGNNIKDTYGSKLDIDGNLIVLINKNNNTVSQITVPYSTNSSTASYASSAGSIEWGNVTNKPTSIAHATNADTAVYASGVDWSNVSNKPTSINHSTNADTAFVTPNALEDITISEQNEIIYRRGNLSTVSRQISNATTAISGLLSSADKTFIESAKKYAAIYQDSADLEAGETTVSFTDPTINSECIIEVFTNNDVHHESYSIIDHTLTVTFAAQENDIKVKVRWS